MKSFSVGGKVGLIIWMHIQFADCIGALEARLAHVGVENHRGLKSFKPSSRSCAAVCVLNVDCVSFCYDRQTRTCLLRNTISAIKNVVSAKCKCHDDKCSFGHGLRYQVFRRHPYVSESGVCGKQPGVMSARRHVLTGVSTYTCLNEESCTSMCGRLKWINPRTHYPLFLPCGSWEEFSVTIRGTPNNDSRFDVFVNKGQDSVFYADFRFKFTEYTLKSHRIVCNTLIRNNWGREHTSMNHKLYIGRECIVKIILRQGIYRLDVDGRRRCEIAEGRRGAQPEFIVIRHDITVHSVEIAD